MTGALQSAFARDGFADLTALIAPELRARVGAEVVRALDAHAVRRDVRVAATGSSPRRYRVVGRDVLAQTCPATAAAYRSRELLALVSAVAGEPVAPVPYLPEELIATRLEAPGDTHGWHWDDYRYALVWVVQAPAAAAGAAVELIGDVPWCKSAPQVDAIVASRTPLRAHVAGGSVYLLRADTTLHRVAPLERAALRDAVCFSYAGADDFAREVSHETLDAILHGEEQLA